MRAVLALRIYIVYEKNTRRYSKSETEFRAVRARWLYIRGDRFLPRDEEERVEERATASFRLIARTMRNIQRSISLKKSQCECAGSRRFRNRIIRIT